MNEEDLFIEQMRMLYEAFDTRHIGIIEMEIFLSIIKRFELDPRSMLQLVKECSPEEGNKDEGFISLETFTAVMLAKYSSDVTELTSREIVSAFRELDSDETGMIPTRRLAMMILNTEDPPTEEETRDLVKQFDIFGKGIVNYEDLTDRMLSFIDKVKEEAERDLKKEVAREEGIVEEEEVYEEEMYEEEEMDEEEIYEEEDLDEEENVAEEEEIHEEVEDTISEMTAYTENEESEAK